MKKTIHILVLLLLMFGISQAQDNPFGHKGDVTKSMFPDDTLKVGSLPDSAVFIYHGRIIKAVWQGSPFSMNYVENLSHTLDSLGILIDMLSIIGTDTSLYRTNTTSGMMKYGDLATILGKMDSTRVNDLLALKANLSALGTMAYADSLFWKSLIVITNAILKDSLYASGNSSEYLNGQLGWTTPGGSGGMAQADSGTVFTTPYQLDTTYNILKDFIDGLISKDDTINGDNGYVVTKNYLLTQAYLQEITGLHLDNVFSSTGLLKRTGATTYSTITDNSTDWNTAYTYRLESATGTGPLTLSLSSNALTGELTGTINGYVLRSNGTNFVESPPDTVGLAALLLAKQAASASLTSLAAITPSANALTLLAHTFLQMFTDLGIDTALAAKLDTTEVAPFDTTGIDVFLNNNELYYDSENHKVKLRQRLPVSVYPGEFTDLAIIDTMEIEGVNSYDYPFASAYAASAADTATQTLNVWLGKDTAIIVRKYPQNGESDHYSIQIVGGALATPTAVTATQSTSTSIAVTWTNPATTLSVNARTVNSLAIAYSLANGYTTLAEYGDSTKTVGLTGTDSLTSLETNNTYHVKLFSLTAWNESTAGASDTAAIAPEIASGLLSELRAYYCFDESSGHATDSSGRGNTLTNNNNAPYETGVRGNCARSDSATNAYFSTAWNNDLNLGDSTTTMCVWIQPCAVSTFDDEYFMGVFYEWRLIRGYSTLYLRLYGESSSTAGQVSGGNIIDTTAWYFVAWKFRADDDSLFISVNGGAWTRGVCSVPPVTYGSGDGYGLTVGRFQNTRASALFDNFGIWRRELTDDEIEWLYNSGAGRHFSEF